MWKMKNSINNEIWKYFLLFSIVILSLLWVFQVLFLDRNYKTSKTNDIKSVANTIKRKQFSPNFENIINKKSLDKEVCVEITDDTYSTLYSTTFFGKGCLSGKEDNTRYKFEFISSNLDEQTYQLVNPIYNNETLIYAVKLNNNRYAFVNTSLDPIDSTSKIITEQLIVITIFVLIFSFILSYFISNHISKPIIKINDSAKKLANGDYDVSFDNDVDILELNELANTLNYTKQELGKIEEVRRDLMANVSHDMKTPLTMIKAYAEMSRDLHSNNKLKREENMNIIIDEVDRLSILVDDILTLSKVQSNIEKLNIEEFDLIELISEIIKRYSIFQVTENYNFNFIYKENSIMINADKKMIEQVIYNLINNAINYTGDDKVVTIKISLADNILVEIIDTGKGINKSELPYIWDKYYKNKKKHKRNLIGTGLGLSIVKNILKLHEYEYGVKSRKNKGSTFYFIIPKNKKEL